MTYSERELYEITQLARLKFLGEEVAKQVMTEDEQIVATMACLKYIDLDLIVDEDGNFKINDKWGLVSKTIGISPFYDEKITPIYLMNRFTGLWRGIVGEKHHILNEKGLKYKRWYDMVWCDKDIDYGKILVRKDDEATGHKEYLWIPTYEIKDSIKKDNPQHYPPTKKSLNWWQIITRHLLPPVLASIIGLLIGTNIQ